MNEFVIKAENLGKQYRIGGNNGYPGNKLLQEIITDFSKAPFKIAKKIFANTPVNKVKNKKHFWALRDVSFEIKQGEILGVIGHNGAGKSTLLKILSRITSPTSGFVQIYGRVGSLLEVGTGFHSELTGRENIYLNGAILGMKKAEIKRKFDEIVSFAEVEDFLDTPVKYYSSGMYVRLAFAVAAHLEPEILLVDEVLAVGDIDFQKKCIGSMQSVAKSGRTVLVVSHNMALIESLCGSAIWLNHGKIQSYGKAHDIVSDYAVSSQDSYSEDLLNIPRNNQSNIARFSRIQITNAEGINCNNLKMGDSIIIKLEILAAQLIRKPWIGIQIRTQLNHLLFLAGSREAGYELQPIEGVYYVKCYLDKLNLLPGRYFVDLILADMIDNRYDEIKSAAHFDVRPADIMDSGMPMNSEYGLVFFNNRWEANTHNKM